MLPTASSKKQTVGKRLLRKPYKGLVEWLKR
jgi:hypothetical protein